MTPSGGVAAQPSRYVLRVGSLVIGRLQEGSRLELTVPSSISLRQEPKSARRMWPFTSSRMLSGLMSLKEERQGQNQASLFFGLSSEQKIKTGSKLVCILQRMHQVREGGLELAALF